MYRCKAGLFKNDPNALTRCVAASAAVAAPGSGCGVGARPGNRAIAPHPPHWRPEYPGFFGSAHSTWRRHTTRRSSPGSPAESPGAAAPGDGCTRRPVPLRRDVRGRSLASVRTKASTSHPYLLTRRTKRVPIIGSSSCFCTCCSKCSKGHSALADLASRLRSAAKRAAVVRTAVGSRRPTAQAVGQWWLPTLLLATGS